jgi:hypothetical protein
MALAFPNESRHYDEAMDAVRFWGHDGPMEASFFVAAHALTTLQPGAPADETGLLGAFDANRELIYRTAIKVYSRGRKGAYDLLASDF